MTNPLPKAKQLTPYRILRLIALVVEAIKTDGRGHIPTIKSRNSNSMTVAFDDGSEFIIYVKSQASLQ